MEKNHQIGKKRNIFRNKNFSTTIGNISIENRQNSFANVNNVRCGKVFEKNLDEFLINTSLHGLKYIGDTKISPFERIFFFLSFIVVFLLSAYFITNVYRKWSATPIIIGTNPTPTYISSIPFPAVTVCNFNQAKRSRVKNIGIGTLDYSLVQSLCAREVDVEANISDHSGRWSYFRQLLLHVSQPCNELLVACRFGSIKKDCTTIFRPVLTDEGLCCMFNAVDPAFMYKNYTESDDLHENDVEDGAVPVDWTPEDGYTDNNLAADYYPSRAIGAGSHLGLTIVLNANAREYYCSSTSSIGFKILLHNPTEIPKISNYGILMPVGQESRLVITPTYANASPALRGISKKVRFCLFANEAKLTYYRTYSKKNCELECESHLVQRECGCILYYMPRTSSDAVICGFKDLQCSSRVRTEIELSTNKNFSCENCLPGCYELGYSAQISSSSFSSEKFYVREKYLQNINPSVAMNNIAIVHIFYAANSFRSHTAEELIGFTDFLSNTGGLLGLFMGFSVLSIVEIIYFITLRPYCEFRRETNTKWRCERRKRGPVLRQLDGALKPQLDSQRVGSVSKIAPSKSPAVYKNAKSVMDQFLNFNLIAGKETYYPYYE